MTERGSQPEDGTPAEPAAPAWSSPAPWRSPGATEPERPEPTRPQAPPGWGGPPPGPPSYGAPPPPYQPQYGQPSYGQPAYGQPPQYAAPGGWGGPPAGPPAPGVVPLRPLGLGELLDGAVGVVRRYPRPTLGLSVVVALLSTALGVLLLVLLPSDLLTTSSTSQELDDAALGGAALGSVATLLVTGLAGIVLSGVITAVVGRAVLGQPMTVGEAWRTVRPRLLRLVGLALLVGLLVVAALGAAVLLAVLCYAVAGGAGLLLGVPLALVGVAAGVYLFVRFSLAAPALVLEKVGVLEALRRSGVLVRRSFWRVFGVLLLAALVAGVVGQVVQVPFLVLGGRGLFSRSGEVGIGGLVLLQIGSGLAQVITAPFTSGVRALLYIDRRMRAEGLDVALAAAAAARR